MADDDKIKYFVRTSLGCACPDEVFEHIEHQEAIKINDDFSLSGRLNIGNRLLIYIIEAAEPDFITGNLSKLIKHGKAERDSGGFNRFRLVVVTENLMEIKPAAEDSFENITDKDERVHLHIINKTDFEKLIP